MAVSNEAAINQITGYFIAFSHDMQKAN